MGVVANRGSSSTEQPLVASLVDAFMRLYKENNDYSLIYSSIERDGRIGMECGPVATILHSGLPWHSFGKGQRAYHDLEGLWWEDMVILYRAQVLRGTRSRVFENGFMCQRVQT